MVVGEDIAATAGLAFALLDVAATMLTGNPVYAAIGSGAIGVLLLGVAVFVGVEVKALAAAINTCERAVRARFPEVRWLFFEPDVEA